MKPVGEEVVNMATTSALPTTPQTEGHQGTAGEVNGFISPSEEAPRAPQLNAVHDGSAATPRAPPGKPATAAPLERPTSLQAGQQPEKDATSPTDRIQAQPPVKGDHKPQCLPTNSFSLDSAETSVISPSSLSDSDLLEAAFDGTSSPTPEQPADLSVNVHIKDVTDMDTTQSVENSVMGEGKDETSNKTSHLPETAGQEKAREEGVKTSGRDEVRSLKHSDPKKKAIALGEGIRECDVPDGLEPEDLPSASEPPALKPGPKKQMKLFKRNKKKSHQGNLSIHLNKAHSWNASLLMFLKGKPLFIFVFIAFFIFICSLF